MKLLAFRTLGVDEMEIVLHPRITVITGLDPARRARLAASLAAMLQGDVGAGEAIFDVDGVRLPLTDAVWRDPDLELSSPVLRAADLPGALVDVVAPEIQVIVEPSPAPVPDPEPAPEPELVLVVDEDERAAWRAARDAADAAAVAAGRRLAVAEGSVVERQRAINELEQRSSEARARRDAIASAPPPEPHWEQRIERQAHAGLVADARAELARAERELAELERSDKATDPQLVAALDAAHRAVLDEEDRMGRNARRRYDDALAQERAVLDQMGMPSYEAYLVRTSVLELHSRETRSAQARLALADARAVWEELHADEDAPAPPAVVDLRAEEAAHGVTQLGHLLTVAHDGLVAVEKERAAATDAVAAARAALDALVLEEPQPRLVSVAPDTVLDLSELAPAVVVDIAVDTADTTGVDAEELEIYLLSRLLAHRSGAGRAGSMPLIVDDACTRLAPPTREAALALLSRMAPGVQVVYLTDDTDIEFWAIARGPEDALLVDAPARAGSPGVTAR